MQICLLSTLFRVDKTIWKTGDILKNFQRYVSIGIKLYNFYNILDPWVLDDHTLLYSHTISKNHIPHSQTHVETHKYTYAHSCKIFSDKYTHTTSFLNFNGGERKDAILLLPMRCIVWMRSCFTHVHVFIFL